MEKFYTIIAIFFLFIFLLKLLSPKFFPFIGKFFSLIMTYIKEIFKILIKGFFYSITLLFSRTVYVMGIVVILTIIAAITYTTIQYPNISEYEVWFDHFKKYILNIYVITFFSGTYVIGVIHYIKDKDQIKSKFINYFDSKFKTNFQKQYVYDEETKKYTYK